MNNDSKRYYNFFTNKPNAQNIVNRILRLKCFLMTITSLRTTNMRMQDTPW